jgi:hypothetical protein
MKMSSLGAALAALFAITSAFGSELEAAHPPAPLIPGMLENNAAPTLRIGAYVGALADQSLINITVLRPWQPNFASGILVDAHAVYRPTASQPSLSSSNSREASPSALAVARPGSSGNSI